MPLTKNATKIDNIQGLGNLTLGQATAIKTLHDKAGSDIKDYLNNTLTVELDTLVSGVNTNLQNQITSNDGDITVIQGRVTTNEGNIVLKANKTDVYTKTEMDPFLRGGDTLIVYEVFTIVNSNLGNSTFSYRDKNNTLIIGTLGISGNQIFTLQQGTYDLGQNRINLTVNDTLQRSVASGGLDEIDPTHIALTSPEGVGAELTIQYFERIGITGTGLAVQGTVAPPSNFFWNEEV